MLNSLKYILSISIMVLFFSANVHAFTKETKSKILNDIIETSPKGLGEFLSHNKATIDSILKDSLDVKSLKNFNVDSDFKVLTAKIRSLKSDPYNTSRKFAQSINIISDYVNPHSDLSNRMICDSVTVPYVFEYDGYNSFVDTNKLTSDIQKKTGNNKCYKNLSSYNNDNIYSVTVNTISDYFISAWKLALNDKEQVKSAFNIVREGLKPAASKKVASNNNSKSFNELLGNVKFHDIEQLNKMPEVDKKRTQLNNESKTQESGQMRTPSGGRDSSTRSVDLLGLTGSFKNGKLRVGFFYKNTDTDELVQWRKGSVGTSCQVYENTGDILRPVKGALITTYSKTVKSSHQDVYINIPSGYINRDVYEIVDCQVDTGWRELSSSKLYNLSELY